MIPIRQIQAIESDEDLLLDYQQNDNQQSLATLYLRYTHLVYGVGLKYYKNEEMSKDAVMEVYQKICVTLKTNQVENFKSWLYVVVKNYCLMDLRKKKTITVSFGEAAFMQSNDFSHLDAVLEKEKDFKQLEVCIEQLNNEQRSIINQFYLQQKCYNEIVAITGMDWNKVRSLVQNGRRNLKICMEKNGR